MGAGLPVDRWERPTELYAHARSSTKCGQGRRADRDGPSCESAKVVAGARFRIAAGQQVADHRHRRTRRRRSPTGARSSVIPPIATMGFPRPAALLGPAPARARRSRSPWSRFRRSGRRRCSRRRSARPVGDLFADCASRGRRPRRPGDCAHVAPAQIVLADVDAVGARHARDVGAIVDDDRRADGCACSTTTAVASARKSPDEPDFTRSCSSRRRRPGNRPRQPRADRGLAPRQMSASTMG